MKSEESPRSRTTFLVLLALSHRPMHGYEISKFIEDKSRGFFRVPFGSLYPVLHRLESGGTISAAWEPGDSQKPKKTYSMTERGRAALKEEMSLFHSLSDAIVMLSPRGI